LPTSALLGINGQSLYKTADATAPNQEATLPQNWDSLTAFGEPMFETGVFTVGPKGEVGVDFLLDGGSLGMPGHGEEMHKEQGYLSPPRRRLGHEAS